MIEHLKPLHHPGIDGRQGGDQRLLLLAPRVLAVHPDILVDRHDRVLIIVPEILKLRMGHGGEIALIAAVKFHQLRQRIIVQLAEGRHHPVMIGEHLLCLVVLFPLDDL